MCLSVSLKVDPIDFLDILLLDKIMLTKSKWGLSLKIVKLPNSQENDNISRLVRYLEFLCRHVI